MRKIRNVEFVNLVIFAFGNIIDSRIAEAREYLERSFGPIDLILDVPDFSKFTYYYNKEMGNSPIQGRLMSFRDLIHPSELANIKLRTNEIEEIFAFNGKRTINLDSGYIHHTQFVLASTKHWANRIYLSEGIYAEITLMYINGAFHELEYTYPNYKSSEYKRALEKIREFYMNKRKLFYTN